MFYFSFFIVSCLVFSLSSFCQAHYIRYGGNLEISLPNHFPQEHMAFVGSMNASALGSRTLAAIDAFRTDPSAVALVFSSPISETILAPANKFVEANPSSKWTLGSLTKAFGTLVGYEEEESKTLFKNIHDFSYANPDYVPEGSNQKFGWHFENLVHPNTPEFVMMLCERQDDEQVVETIFLPAAEVVGALSASTVQILQQPLFTVEIEDTLLLDALSSNIIPEKVPILVAPATAGDAWKIYYDSTFMKGSDAASAAALAELNAVSGRLGVSLKLKTGDIVVWKNHLAAHDRRSEPVYYAILLL